MRADADDRHDGAGADDDHDRAGDHHDHHRRRDHDDDRTGDNDIDKHATYHVVAYDDGSVDIYAAHDDAPLDGAALHVAYADVFAAIALADDRAGLPDNVRWYAGLAARVLAAATRASTRRAPRDPVT